MATCVGPIRESVRRIVGLLAPGGASGAPARGEMPPLDPAELHFATPGSYEVRAL